MLDNIIMLVSVSSGTVPNTCIYPLSSVAFLIVLLQEAVNEWQPSKGISKILISRYDLVSIVPRPLFFLYVWGSIQQ